MRRSPPIAARTTSRADRTGLTVARHVTLAVAAAVLSGGLLRARAPQSGPVFRASTDLVAVDALVTDDQGHVVSGLTAEDFRIVEKNRPQTIRTFTFVAVPPTSTALATPDTIGPVRDVVTNQASAHSRVFAIVVDDLHLLALNQERVRNVLTDLLETLPVTDRVAVVFTGRSDLSIDLTDDRAVQWQAIGRVRDALGFAMDPSPINCGVKEVQRRQQAIGTLNVLANVSSVLAHTRADERTVIYVSEGLNYDFAAMPNSDALPMIGLGAQAHISSNPELTCNVSGVTDQPASTSPLPGNPQEDVSDASLVRRTLQETLAAATNNDVRIYTVDPRGSLPVDAELAGAPPQDPVARQALRSKVTVQNDFLRAVAAGTGALAAVQASDLPGAIRHVLTDTSSYYLLGFSPDPAAADGQFHDFDVTLTRPGLHLRARKGYVAPTKSGDGALKGFLPALGEGDVRSELSLSASVTPLTSMGDVTKSALIVEVAYPGRSEWPATVADDLQLEVLRTNVEGGKGQLVSNRAFHFSATQSRAGDLVFLLNEVIDLPTGVVNLRVGVAGKTGDVIGTLALPLRVPNLNDKTLQIGGAVLGVAGSREPALPADAFKGLLPFEPTLTRIFTPKDSLRLYAPVSWGGDIAAVDVTLELTGPGTPAKVTFGLSADSTTGDLHRAAIDRTVSLAALTEGDHQLSITITEPRGKTVAKTIGFRVSGSPHGT